MVITEEWLHELAQRRWEDRDAAYYEASARACLQRAKDEVTDPNPPRRTHPQVELTWETSPLPDVAEALLYFTQDTLDPWYRFDSTDAEKLPALLPRLLSIANRALFLYARIARETRDAGWIGPLFNESAFTDLCEEAMEHYTRHMDALLLDMSADPATSDAAPDPAPDTTSTILRTVDFASDTQESEASSDGQQPTVQPATADAVDA